MDAFPVQISASEGSTTFVLLNTFQKRRSPKKTLKVTVSVAMDPTVVGLHLRNGEVCRDEGVRIPWSEGIKPVENYDDCEVHNGGPGKVRLEGRSERQVVSIYALPLQSSIKAHVGDTDCEPREHRHQDCNVS